MLLERYSPEVRKNREVELTCDLTVVGGGLSGVCAAVTAAREGTKVVLIQDRPVLGGNASSEVRLWALGATSHMGNNNRWSREGGVINELLTENLFRNREGNSLIFDTIILEKVREEKNITLLLNTSVYNLNKGEGDDSDYEKIECVEAFNSQNSTKYRVTSPLFCDSSGDGIISFMAGVPFRMGAESSEEFGEKFTPKADYGELLGHSLYFYSKTTDRPVKYTPPSFALKDIKSNMPKYKIIRKEHKGCNFWWIEYGGRMDTVHDTEEIKWELWKVVYGVWDYIKNSGDFEDVENMDLEWVGTTPGKRESRRFEGEYMLKQQDLIEQREFYDAVAFGGWSLDLHNADGVYGSQNSCDQWHSKGVYQIPYRCFTPQNIENLFITGRIISTTHVAFASSRVMGTCAHGAQAVAVAASLCIKNNLKPSAYIDIERIVELQNRLNEIGQSIPGQRVKSTIDSTIKVEASSRTKLSTIPFNGEWLSLTTSAAQLLPLSKGERYSFKIEVNADIATKLTSTLRISEKSFNYTPDTVLEQIDIDLKGGRQIVDIQFKRAIPNSQFAFICFHSNSSISIRESEYRQSALLSLFNGEHKAVSNSGKQTPPEDIGIEEFEFWTPKRRPEGKNIAMQITPPIESYGEDNITNGFTRPWILPNVWVSDIEDTKPTLYLNFDKITSVSELTLLFDPDYDHAMECTLYGHPESRIPLCVEKYKIFNDKGELIWSCIDNHQGVNRVALPSSILTSSLTVEMEHPESNIPASLFQIIVR